jgi:hypothetical protein
MLNSLKWRRNAAKRPLASAKYVSLADFYDRLGRATFLQDWTGSEINTPQTFSLDEAIKLDKELRAKRAKLQQQAGRSSDEYVEALIRQNELLGDLDLEYLAGEPDLRDLVYRLDWLSTYFRKHPPLEDATSYEQHYQAFRRHTETIGTLEKLLANGTIHALAATSSGRQVVHEDVWGAESVSFDICASAAQIGSKRLSKVCFSRVDVDRYLSIVSKHGATASPAKRTIETEALDALMQLMVDGAKRPKRSVRQEFMRRFPGLTARGFDKVWTRACEASDSGWDQPGRPSGS